MTQTVQMFDIYGKSTGYSLNLTRLDEAKLSIVIDENFAGREVNEEIAVADLLRLANEANVLHDDILGLILQSEGTEIKGLVGVGSGNERFVVSQADVRSALDDLNR